LTWDNRARRSDRHPGERPADRPRLHRLLQRPIPLAGWIPGAGPEHLTPRAVPLDALDHGPGAFDVVNCDRCLTHAFWSVTGERGREPRHMHHHPAHRQRRPDDLLPRQPRSDWPTRSSCGRGSLNRTTPQSLGSLARQASSPKSLSNVSNMRPSSTALASTDWSALPGASVRIQTTS
jgi:hypothetical protein